MVEAYVEVLSMEALSSAILLDVWELILTEVVVWWVIGRSEDGILLS